MIHDRFASLMHRLTPKVVFADLLAPVRCVLGVQGLGRTQRGLSSPSGCCVSCLGGGGCAAYPRALRRQPLRQAKRAKQLDGSDRPDWMAP